MKKLFTALIMLSLPLLLGTTAHAAVPAGEASVVITATAPGEYSGDVTVVDWNEGEAQSIVDSGVLTVMESPAAMIEYGREAAPSLSTINFQLSTLLSVESLTENGAAIIKMTYEAAQGLDPNALIQPFERDGYSYSCREVLRHELPGKTLSRPAAKTAIYMSDTNDEAEILRQFPDSIYHEEAGYTGLLRLDITTFKTDGEEFERYAYGYTRSREIPGLARNDPHYIDREWNGMVLSNVSFTQGADGKYTATAIYTGTATGERQKGFTTTADYYGEITMTVPGNILYTVVYEQLIVDSGVDAEQSESIGGSTSTPDEEAYAIGLQQSTGENGLLTLECFI